MDATQILILIIEGDLMLVGSAVLFVGWFFPRDW